MYSLAEVATDLHQGLEIPLVILRREALRDLASDVLDDFGQFFKVAGKIMYIGAKIGILFFCEYSALSANANWTTNNTELLGVKCGNPCVDTAFDCRRLTSILAFTEPIFP